MDRISCLIIETDQEAIRHIDILGRTIGSLEVRWKTNSLETGFAIIRKHLPEMLIVGLGQNPSASIEAISALSRDFPTLYLLALSEKSDSDLILRAMRAGAHDFLCKPLKEIDLRAAVEKVYKLKAARKGGNGTTTIAVNLADALVRYHNKKVAVVDLVLSHGDVTMFFNVNPSYSIIDLAKNAQKADYDFLHTLLVKHSSGVYILADPPMIEDGEQISPGHVRDVLNTLRSMFDYIVVDTPHQFDERTLTALEMSDIVLLVSLLNLPSLRNTQKCLSLFGRIGLRDERVRLVLSRYLPNDEIPKDSIEGILNCPVFFAIPNDYPAVIASVNRGKLLRETSPGKDVTNSFREMSDIIVSPPVIQDAQESKKKGLFERFFTSPRRAK